MIYNYYIKKDTFSYRYSLVLYNEINVKLLGGQQKLKNGLKELEDKVKIILKNQIINDNEKLQVLDNIKMLHNCCKAIPKKMSSFDSFIYYEKINTLCKCIDAIDNFIKKYTQED